MKRKKYHNSITIGFVICFRIGIQFWIATRKSHNVSTNKHNERVLILGEKKR